MSQTRSRRSHLPQACKTRDGCHSPSPTHRSPASTTNGECAIAPDSAAITVANRAHRSCVFPRSRSCAPGRQRSSVSPVSSCARGFGGSGVDSGMSVVGRTRTHRASLLPMSPGYRHLSLTNGTSSEMLPFAANLYQQGVPQLPSGGSEVRSGDCCVGAAYQVQPVRVTYQGPTTRDLWHRRSMDVGCIGGGAETSIIGSLLSSQLLPSLPVGVTAVVIDGGGDGEDSGICDEVLRPDTRWCTMRQPGSSASSLSSSSFSTPYSASSSDSCRFALEQQEDVGGTAPTATAAATSDSQMVGSSQQQQQQQCVDGGGESCRTMGFQITSVTKSRLSSVGDDEDGDEEIQTPDVDSSTTTAASSSNQQLSVASTMIVSSPLLRDHQQHQERERHTQLGHDPNWQGRFKVINLRTGVPYCHGRWQCVDYLDICPYTVVSPSGENCNQQQLLAVVDDHIDGGGSVGTAIEKPIENTSVGADSSSGVSSQTIIYQHQTPPTKQETQQLQQQEQLYTTSGRTVRSVDSSSSSTTTTTTTTVTASTAAVTSSPTAVVTAPHTLPYHSRQRSAPVLSTSSRTRSVDTIHSADRVGGGDEGGAAIQPIDNKIEQAMDLVKSHLLLAVREEVNVLNANISQLVERIGRLERENNQLRSCAPPEVLAKLDAAHSRNPGSRRGQ